MKAGGTLLCVVAVLLASGLAEVARADGFGFGFYYDHGPRYSYSTRAYSYCGPPVVFYDAWDPVYVRPAPRVYYYDSYRPAYRSYTRVYRERHYYPTYRYSRYYDGHHSYDGGKRFGFRFRYDD